MQVEELVNQLFEKIKDEPCFMPYLYNAKNKSFDENKDWVYYSGPYWNELEAKAAVLTFITGQWLVSGENVARFENEYSKKFGFKSSVMVNSGSSANLVMISALKKRFRWNDGDEVIVSPVGFPTTVAPLVQNNLKPAFVDVTFSDLNFDLKEVDKKINSNTKAVLLSPVLGNPPDMDELGYICNKKKIILILDGCDSLGTKWKGKYLSDYAHVTSCSFYPAHHITTGEGGMVSSQDEELIHLARSFAWWGRDCYCVGSTNLTTKGACGKRFSKWLDDYHGILDHKYLFTQMGYNLKPLDMQGSIGLVQLKKIDEIHIKRREVKKRLEKIITKFLGGRVRILDEHSNAETSWFGLPIICEDYHLKHKLVDFLEKNRVQTRNYFAGNILLHPGYKHLDDAKSYKESSRVLDHVFFIGCYPGLSEEMITYIGKVFEKFVNL